MNRPAGVDKHPEFRVLLGERRIRAGVRRVARRIGKDYRGTVPVFVGILNGSFIFLADLIREVNLECEVEFLRVISYRRADNRPGNAQLLWGTEGSVRDRDVVIVEDVIDSGSSVTLVRKMIMKAKPRSVRIATLLLKDQYPGTQADYVGFTIPRDFVAGYGLDYSGRMRNRRSIYKLVKPA
jgi:hypoxanthine phosphoribosyltransferase